MAQLHKQCRKTAAENKSADENSSTAKGKGGWNTYLDVNTHKGLEILAEHFDLSKKIIVRTLVSEKLRELKLANPIKEVAIRS